MEYNLKYFRPRTRAYPKQAPKKSKKTVSKKVRGCNSPVGETSHVAEQEPTASTTNGHASGSTKPHPELPALQHYCMLLTTQQSITKLATGPHVFVMRDYQTQHRRLSPAVYHILRQTQKRLGGKLQEIYVCNCCPERSIYTLGLAHCVAEPYEEVFIGMYGDCIHIQAMQLLHASASLNAELVPMVAESDGAVASGSHEPDHAYAETPPEVLYHEVLGCLDAICVQVGDDFGVVVADPAQKKTKCVACAQPYSCIHSQSVEKNLCDTADDLLLQFLCALNRGTVTADIKLSTAISTQNIPFQCASGLQWKQSPLVASSIGHCSNGHPWASASRRTTQKHVFGLQSIDLCPVTTLVCSDCGRTNECDGVDDMVVHMDKYLVTHQVMREYFRGFVSEGTTIYSYFKMWQWRLLDSGCQDAAKLSYVQFRDAWYVYIKLLNICEPEAFSCHSCGKEPTAVIMDGVCVGFRRSFVTHRPEIVPSGQRLRGR